MISVLKDFHILILFSKKSPYKNISLIINSINQTFHCVMDYFKLKLNIEHTFVKIMEIFIYD